MIKLNFTIFLAIIYSFPVWSKSDSLISQYKQLPKGFGDYFFGTPLMANIVIDGQLLGGGEVVLGRDGTVYLLNLSDVSESQFNILEIERWKKELSEKWNLGECKKNCPSNVLMMDYSLTESSLTIVTSQVEINSNKGNYKLLPDDSFGFLINSQLRFSSDSDRYNSSLNLQMEASIDSWTLFSEAELENYQDYNAQSIRQAYAEYLSGRYYTRVGYFTPSSTGLVQPQSYFSSNSISTVGVIFGNSDLLLKKQDSPSLVPIQITGSRPGILEIYKDGRLLRSQLIQPGVQVVDTRPLPYGIYQVELRIIEDGQETQRKIEMVYKPSIWSTPDERWRYNAYAGWQTPDWQWGADNHNSETVFTAGAEFNYLMTPSMILGFGNRYVNNKLHQSLTFDWNALSSLRWFSTLSHSQGMGWSYNTQASLSLDSTSMILGQSANHTNSNHASTTYFSIQYPFQRWGVTNFYLSHQSEQGFGGNINWSHASRLYGKSATWGVSVFDNPANNRRDRGVNLTFSINFDTNSRNLSVGLGSQTSQSGKQAQQLNMAYRQDMDFGPLKQLGIQTFADSESTDFSAFGYYSADWVEGDMFLQGSSSRSNFSSGINMDSSVAIGRNGSAISSSRLQGAAVVLDIESDSSGADLRVYDDQGGNYLLGSGRNLVPVTALENGTLQFEMANPYASPLTISPSVIPYYLNRGGVGYHKIQVVKTVVVIGRLVNENHQPLAGAKIINHVGRTISEPDGFFVVDVSLRHPTLTVETPTSNACKLSLEDIKGWKENDTVLIGDLLCKNNDVANVNVNV